jgi:hypothetical protein
MNIDAWYESRKEYDDRFAEFDIEIWEEKRSNILENREENRKALEEHEGK